jgi:hypothetical protein
LPRVGRGVGNYVAPPSWHLEVMKCSQEEYDVTQGCFPITKKDKLKPKSSTLLSYYKIIHVWNNKITSINTIRLRQSFAKIVIVVINLRDGITITKVAIAITKIAVAIAKP